MATTKIFPIRVTEVAAITYIADDEKTDNGRLIYTFGCDKNPVQASKDFAQVRSMGTGLNSVLSQHFIQSFSPGEITPEQALQAAENANGRVQNNSENPTENSSENTENEEVSMPVQTQKNSMNMNIIYLVIGAVVLVAVGFIAMKFMKKPKKNVTSEDENYDFYDDSDDEE